ncbi:MAG: putative baseplate assembly protein [Deltaproteobacteria bacterium]|nr:putative baseplate assembly protein [Deltaproteobacteria bacterium]
MLWEFLSKEGWKELRLFKDGTSAFSQKGAIEFIPSPEWSEKAIFGQEGYWLRARWEAGNYTVSPKLAGMHLNPVEVIQALSIRNEVLGSSNGEAYQTHTFSNSPILPNPKIMVKEFKNPSAEQIKRIKEELKDDVFEDVDPDGKVTALRIRWYEVENFFKSSSESRHYTLDLYKAAVTFGDGKKGKIPPAGVDNIKSDLYYIGGGSRGNVGKNTITLLDESYPSVEGIRNPDAAGGGADAETIEDAKLRGPWSLKHRYRAVTIEDFEKLAFEASGEVAKAKCYVEESEVRLIIVPKGDLEKLRPGNMLLQTIKKYLDDRRLITTRLKIAGPGYMDISIEAEVSVVPQKVEIIPEIKIMMELELRNFFHPLKGGPAKNGWPMGRSVHISEIYNVLENIEEVDFVRRLNLNKNPWLNKVEIGKINYPFLKEANFKVS